MFTMYQRVGCRGGMDYCIKMDYPSQNPLSAAPLFPGNIVGMIWNARATKFGKLGSFDSVVVKSWKKGMSHTKLASWVNSVEVVKSWKMAHTLASPEFN
jgi:hypothetical protein